MFVEAFKKAKASMFPIFRFQNLKDGRTSVGVAGTGFFLNEEGFFATTAHVFDAADEATKFMYLGLLPDQLQNPGLEIKVASVDDSNDVAIGKIEIVTPNHVEFAKELPEEGKSACICGYPLAVIAANNIGGIEVGGVRRYFQPTFVLDKVSVGSTNPKGKVRTHDGFLLRDVGLFGMSGGPVLDIDGKLIGMQGSVTQPRESENGSGRKISVENAIAIRGQKIVDLAKRDSINCSQI